MNLSMPKGYDSDPSSHTNDDEQAQIYRKCASSNHQRAINEAAANICVSNPAMLTQRKELLEQAKEQIHNEGFAYNKGKSRSKKFGDPQSTTSKRPKIDSEVRRLRMREIRDNLKSFKESISFKERRRSQAESTRNYQVCEVELREHQHKIRELEAELQSYEGKEKKSNYHHRRKVLKSPPPFSSESDYTSNIRSSLGETIHSSIQSTSDSTVEVVSRQSSLKLSNKTERK